MKCMCQYSSRSLCSFPVLCRPFDPSLSTQADCSSNSNIVRFPSSKRLATTESSFMKFVYLAFARSQAHIREPCVGQERGPEKMNVAPRWKPVALDAFLEEQYGSGSQGEKVHWEKFGKKGNNASTRKGRRCSLWWAAPSRDDGI